MRDKIALAQTAPISRRVLVAEDDAATMLMVRAILDREGYTSVPARNGREAYQILRADADFAAAILDMNMPHLRGLDVVIYMNTEKRLRRIPVLVMTAEKDLQLWAQSHAAGVLFFLPKPFTTERMKTMVRLLIGKAPSSDVLPVGNRAVA